MDLKSTLSIVVVVCLAFLATTSDAVDDAADGDRPVVRTATATIRGERTTVQHRQLGADFRRDVAVFNNIPFAEPPLGDLRYAEPVPKKLEGDFEAGGDPRACLQFKNPFMYDDSEVIVVSEDCLYLDVVVPEPKPTSAAVMVWIHGGGYHYGTKGFQKLNGIPLAAVEDVIIVSLNYRLGLLGFLSTEDGTIPGNLGLLDQRLGLLWIKENIEAFGGDPNRVTIFGESAGSGSVNCHLLSPMSAGLFSGAIMQSGAMTPTWSFKTAKQNAAMTSGIGEILGCETKSSMELLGCLRGKTEEEFIAFQENAAVAMLYLVAPVADGRLLPEDPMKAHEDGLFNPVNVMVGALGHEGNLFAMPMMMGMEGYDKVKVNRTTLRTFISMQSQIMDPLILDLIEFTYLSADQLTSTDPDEDYVDQAAQFVGDRILLCPAFSAAKSIAAAGRPTYTYLMTHSPAYSLWGKNYTWLEDTHAEDIPYVFGTPFLSNDGGDSFLRGRFDDDEVPIARRIMKYWANFAKSGDPNIASYDEGQDSDQVFPAWPQFTSETMIYKDISRTMENISGTLPNARECYFLEEILPKLIENAAEIARLKSLLEEEVSKDGDKTCEDPASCPEQ